MSLGQSEARRSKLDFVVWKVLTVSSHPAPLAHEEKLVGVSQRYHDFVTEPYPIKLVRGFKLYCL